MTLDEKMKTKNKKPEWTLSDKIIILEQINCCDVASIKDFIRRLKEIFPIEFTFYHPAYINRVIDKLAGERFKK
jgi:phage terminase large subunit-like protein